MDNTSLPVSDAPIPPDNEHDSGAKIVKSVNELNNLSISIQAFKNRYDELQNHLNFIQQAIDTRTKELQALATTTTTAAIVSTTDNNGHIVQSELEPESKSKSKADCEGVEEAQQQQQPDDEEEEEEEDPEEEEEVIEEVEEEEEEIEEVEEEVEEIEEEVEVEEEEEIEEEEEEEEEVEEPKERKKEKKEEDEVRLICKMMDSRGLRRYIITHLSETAFLKEKIPVALKTAPEPAKLVFECIGRFYLQGSKAYTRNSPMITGRQASVLALEYYLMSGCCVSEAHVESSSVKKDAETAAVSWRKRLVVEGGVGAATEMDARGLILFIACFGIPHGFRNEDILNLVLLSKSGEISHVLRNSKVLTTRVSYIAEGMMKFGKVVEAIDLAYTFGFEEKLSPRTALTSFLQKSDEAWKKAKQAHDVPILLRRANEKYLSALKSVINCLEDHKVDIAKLLPAWKLKDTVLKLEKDIGAVTEKFEDYSVKRKLDKSNVSEKVKVPDTKRTRFAGRDPFVLSPSVTALQGQRITSHMDGDSSYDSSLTARYLEGRSHGYPNNYPTAASAQIGSVSGSLPEGYLGRGVSSGVSTIGGAIAGSLSGYQNDISIDNVGTTLNRNSPLYSRLHSIDEGVLSYNRSVEQSFVGQPSSARVNHLYGRTSAEDYAVRDHHSTGALSRGGSSDLYSFADAVFDV